MSIKVVFGKIVNLFLLIILSTSIFGQNEVQKAGNDTSYSDVDLSYFNEVDSLSASINPADSLNTDTLIQAEQEESVLDHEVIYDAIDSILFDLSNNEVHLYGNAIVTYGDITLTAYKITYNFDDYSVIAQSGTDTNGTEIGTPVFTQKKETFDAKKITYNFNSQKGYIEEVKTSVSDAYVQAKTSKKQANNQIHIKGGSFSTCDKPNQHYSFKTNKMIVIPDDKIVTGPGYLTFFNKIPVPIALPFAMIPDQNQKASGIILPRYGNAQSTSQGFYLQDGGYYWAINDFIHTKILGSIYANGSWGLKSESRYKVNYKFNGSMRLVYNDFIIGDRDIETGARPSKSFNVNWSHIQDAKASQFSTFNASVNYVSGNAYRDDITSNDEEYINQNINSNISYKYTIPNSPFNLSVNAKLSQAIDASDSASVSTTNEVTLPQLTFNMKRIDLPLSFLRGNSAGSKKWYEKIGLNYSLNAENRLKFNQQQIDTVNINSSNFSEYYNLRNGVRHNATLSTSFKIKTISVSPSVRTTGNWYFSRIEKSLNPDDYSAVTDTINDFTQVWNVSGGVNVTGKMYGMYSFKGEKWLKAMRHQITSSANIAYSPGSTSREYGYFGDDGEFVSYNPYQGAIYSAPNSNPSNTYSFRLINDLEAKVKAKNDSIEEYKKVKFIDNLSLDASFDAMKDSIKWSDIRMSGRFTKLFDVLNINYNAVFDPYAYNNEGRKTNKSWVSETNNLVRIKSVGVAANVGFKSKKTGKKIKPKNEAEQAIQEEYEENPGFFDNLNVPWDVAANYNISINNTPRSTDGILTFEEKISHTLGLRGSFTVFKMFRFSVTTGYDFVALEWNPSTIGLYVDLHCWELSASLRPNGRRKSYSFSINIKSSLLSDLKIKKENTYGGGSGYF